jgi:hypothetical protein
MKRGINLFKSLVTYKGKRLFVGGGGNEARGGIDYMLMCQEIL